jgi:hypothetical protein
MLIKGKGSIEERIKKEKEANRQMRRQEDVLAGRSMAKKAQRGDFGVTKTFDNLMADYRKFKGKGDREKIEREYRQAQRESRRV